MGCSSPDQLLEHQALIGLAKQNGNGSRQTDIHQTTVNVKGIQVMLQRSSHRPLTFAWTYSLACEGRAKEVAKFSIVILIGWSQC
jgi:hypothetical protein